MLRRVFTSLATSVALAVVASSAFAVAAQAEPPGANGYKSAYQNLLNQQAANRAAGKAVTANTVTAANEPDECGAAGYIKSTYNGLYVSAEFGYTGNNYAMLRARSSTVGSWELFHFCWFPRTGTYSIISNVNKLWTSAELGYGGNQYGMLRARSGTVGPWERYRVWGLTNGYYAIESTANGRAVSAEFGYSGGEYGMLRARAEEFGPWERYNIEPNP